MRRAAVYNNNNNTCYTFLRPPLLQTRSRRRTLTRARAKPNRFGSLCTKMRANNLILMYRENRKRDNLIIRRVQYYERERERVEIRARGGVSLALFKTQRNWYILTRSLRAQSTRDRCIYNVVRNSPWAFVFRAFHRIDNTYVYSSVLGRLLFEAVWRENSSHPFAPHRPIPTPSVFSNGVTTSLFEKFLKKFAARIIYKNASLFFFVFRSGTRYPPIRAQWREFCTYVEPPVKKNPIRRSEDSDNDRSVSTTVSGVV